MLENLKKPVRERPCAVRKILESLEPADQKILSNALVDVSWSAANLAAGLKQVGVTVSSNTIVRHRNLGCSCEEVG